MIRPPIIVLAVTAAFAGVAHAERWKLQYFYDEDRSSLTINDLQFPSPRRGVAVGYLTVKDRPKPTALVTSDGGLHWTLVPIKEVGLSLFFLDETLGWMVTPRGIWQTEESGRSWRKLDSPANILRVHFLNAQRGWAVGAKKTVYETTDGGKNWTKVPAAEEPKSNPEYTHYGWIEFADGKSGVIGGWSRPPRRADQRLPDWVDPEKAERAREWPAMSILLETRNGGQTWTPSTASIFGRITRIRFSPQGWGLGLIEFAESFEWPSEVFRMDWRTGKSVRVFRKKDRAVTDAAVFKSGPAYLAAVESLGKLRRSPVPGKLIVLRSDNLSEWKEMEVDYRATARRAILASADEKNIWVATDTGMILKLQ